MATYRFCTDATDALIEGADSVDAAAAEFAHDEEIRGVKTLADLERHIERVGGWMQVTDEAGDVLANVE